ncbi:unnamed protein product [Mesocestoides corti]|uniref:CCR4-NOT transcription complex subunit 9 n=1 Tax=Mesocestoides corti TaxID=53468 RepID=A0A0R3UI74_MESCO|nr:unnamed protein product [Mesocestoides corti]
MANMNISQNAMNSNAPEIELYTWITNLNNSETREKALLELKMRENFPDFAPLLWHSFGAISSLLQEICAVYPYINPPNLTAHQSNRVCNALALLQCLASHPATRSEFLKANIPLYLYNFLSTNNRTRPFEYLRLTSLGVIGALAKTDEQEAINFLLSSEIIPLCLHIMESGSELSKTVATFIMQKLLQDNVGLEYICQTYERFAHVAAVLSTMVDQLAKEQSLRLLKHVIRCYQRLSDNSRARDALRTCLPEHLRNGTFSRLIEKEPTTKRCLNILVQQLSLPNQPQLPASSTGAGGGGTGGAAGVAAGTGATTAGIEISGNRGSASSPVTGAGVNNNSTNSDSTTANSNGKSGNGGPQKSPDDGQ